MVRSQMKEMFTPEFLLLAILKQKKGEALIACYSNKQNQLELELEGQVNQLNKLPEGEENIDISTQMSQVMDWSEMIAAAAGRDEIDIPHMLNAMLHLEDSWSKYLLTKYTTKDEGELMATIVKIYEDDELPTPDTSTDEDDIFGDWESDYERWQNENNDEVREEPEWKKLVTCVSDHAWKPGAILGREEELERTIQVLCRKNKNNPLHVGEPGVGKTALVYGLAQEIAFGNVPEKLKDAKIYQMDMGSMVAGTSYRGDFEKRIKMVMDGARQEGNAIIYIDEIHTLLGAGTIEGSALDGANILKSYLEAGDIRFIGSTTYQEYNRYFAKDKGLVRRFQQIDVAEPTIEQTVEILEGLQSIYEGYHGVTYADGVIRHAVEASAKYIHDRFLPDKAIDLIDEAGAYRVMHPIMRKYRGEMKLSKKQVVDKQLVNDVLARFCKIDPKSLHEDDNQNLESLASRMQSQIYGQDEAVRQVVEAVQMGKAGLLEEGKPVASLLFVGPTGVGKTEVCKVLAKELGIELVRFDMSEYTEKHTVAKLIGSPAGYVGYEDGGLLTDAIRKTPNCVLLLDEIEKAHADIYNILLQVMDYARLTDNKGQKSDFRHVILVMTSNAGAQYAHQSALGFGANASAGQAMLGAVKKTFKPEFLARLSGTVVFNDMDNTMAGMILDKKLRQLSERLTARRVTMELTPDAHSLLLSKGFTQKLGAREMDRQINQLLSPKLMREILFGKLKKGGHAIVDANGEELCVSVS